MPIPYHVRRAHYGPAWEALSRARRAETPWCECRGECGHEHPGGLCRRPDRLQLAHRDHDPENLAASNLAVWCSVCHMRHDRWQHAVRRAADAAHRAHELAESHGQQRLFAAGPRIPPRLAVAVPPEVSEDGAVQLELL